MRSAVLAGTFEAYAAEFLAKYPTKDVPTSGKGVNDMIEIILPLVLPDKCVVQFDGRILEFFYTSWQEKSHRYHVATIVSIQFLSDKKGAVSLKVQGTSGYYDQMPISPAALPDAQRLLGEVQQAMAQYR